MPADKKIVSFAGTEIFVSKALKIRPSADEEHRVVDNDSNNNDLDHSDEYRIELFATNDSCSPTSLGISEPKTMMAESGENVIWGRVDFFAIRGWDYLPEEAPTCRTPSAGSAYALCSEKDNKTVLICISQITDNPALAEEIFETFQWTE